MLRLLDFLAELLHFLIVGDTWRSRLGKAIFLILPLVTWLGGVNRLQEPLRVQISTLKWAPSPFLPLDLSLSLGYAITFLLATGYVLVALGAALARSSGLGLRFRSKCVDCAGGDSSQLEVWNLGWVKPISNVHLFVDSLTPGFVGRRELSWVGEGRIGIELRARSHAHAVLFVNQPGHNFMAIGGGQRLNFPQHRARITVECNRGSLSRVVLIYPMRDDPRDRVRVGFRRWQ